MAVRAATSSDLDALVALEQECEGPDAWSAALLRDGLSGLLPTVHYLVAESDTAGVVGYAVVACVDDIAELQRIGVAAPHRRLGVASSLLDAVVAWSRNEGAQRLLLEVREHNGAAVAMYAARGFVEIDRRPRYYRDGATAIVMRLPVTKGCSW